MYGSSKDKNGIADSLNFLLDGKVFEAPLVGADEAGGRNKEWGPFLFRHFRDLVRRLRDEATKEEGERSASAHKSGPCTAILPLVESVYDCSIRSLLPLPVDEDDEDEEDEDDDDAARWVSPVVLDKSTMAFEMLKIIASKSATSISGAAGGAIIFCYARLAQGFSADTPVPQFLHDMASCTELGVAKARVLKSAFQAQADGDVTAVQTNLVAHFAQIAATCNVPEVISLIEAAFDNGVVRRPPAVVVQQEDEIVRPSRRTYAEEVAERCMEQLRDHTLEVVTAGLLKVDDISHRGSFTIAQVLSKVFPSLSKLLISRSTLIDELRPVTAHLAFKTKNIWLRHEAYVVVTKRNKTTNALVLNTADITPPWSVTPGTFNVFTLASLVSELSTTLNPRGVRATDICDMVVTVLESYEYVETTQRDEQQCGAASSKATMYRLLRRPQYVADLLHDNNADKKMKSALNLLFQPPTDSRVSSCEKSFPQIPRFTPGIFVAACGSCDVTTCFHAHFMDAHESALTPFEFIMNRFPTGLPQYFVYDNACKLLNYAVSLIISYNISPLVVVSTTPPDLIVVTFFLIITISYYNS